MEKLIGKVKAEKYGNRIVDLIQQYIKSGQPNGDTSRVAEASGNRANKRPRKNKTLVLIESSDDDVVGGE